MRIRIVRYEPKKKWLIEIEDYFLSTGILLTDEELKDFKDKINNINL